MKKQKVRLQARDGHESQQQDHNDRDKDGEWLFDAEFFHDFLSISLFYAAASRQGTGRRHGSPLNSSYHSYYTRGRPSCNSGKANL